MEEIVAIAKPVTPTGTTDRSDSASRVSRNCSVSRHSRSGTALTHPGSALNTPLHDTHARAPDDLETARDVVPARPDGDRRGMGAHAVTPARGRCEVKGARPVLARVATAQWRVYPERAPQGPQHESRHLGRHRRVRGAARVRDRRVSQRSARAVRTRRAGAGHHRARSAAPGHAPIERLSFRRRFIGVLGDGSCRRTAGGPVRSLVTCV